MIENIDQQGYPKIAECAYKLLQEKYGVSEEAFAQRYREYAVMDTVFEMLFFPLLMDPATSNSDIQEKIQHIKQGAQANSR